MEYRTRVANQDQLSSSSARAHAHTHTITLRKFAILALGILTAEAQKDQKHTCPDGHLVRKTQTSLTSAGMVLSAGTGTGDMRVYFADSSHQRLYVSAIMHPPTQGVNMSLSLALCPSLSLSFHPLRTLVTASPLHRPIPTSSLHHFLLHPCPTPHVPLFSSHSSYRASPLHLHRNNIHTPSPLSTLQRTNDLLAILRLRRHLLRQRILIRTLPFSPWQMTTDDST